MLCMTALFFIKARFCMNDGAEKGQNHHPLWFNFTRGII